MTVINPDNIVWKRCAAPSCNKRFSRRRRQQYCSDRCRKAVGRASIGRVRLSPSNPLKTKGAQKGGPSRDWLYFARLPVARDTAVRIAKANAFPSLFGRDTPPINVLGGYRFPGAPELEIVSPAGQICSPANISCIATSTASACAIPVFLRRAAAAVATA
jgi:hypothetical protein